jgi:hypothetical protein
MNSIKPNINIHRFALPLSAMVAFMQTTPAQALEATISADSQEFSKQYTADTKKILQQGIELERFSLNYRLLGPQQPRFRKLRYFLAQEASSSCGLAFEIAGDQQFDLGRRRPLKVNTNTLSHAFTTAMTGSIIGASSSAFELSANMVQAIKNDRKGFSGRAANKFVGSHLKTIDGLLSERATLVEAHKSDPNYARAVAEGKVLNQLRSSFVNEYAHFNADTTRYMTFQNTFFALNTSYNTIAAVAAGLAKRGLTHPKVNGPSNIMFIVTGAIAAASPILCYSTAALAKRYSQYSVRKHLGESPHFDPVAFSSACKELRQFGSSGEGSLIPSLPATDRLALYDESDQLFQKQLDSETAVMRHLDKIALGTSVGGPAIGGLLMTQGILGTYGYYQYGTTRIPRLRREFKQFYHGSVVGTVGTSMSVAGNAAWFLGSLAYEHKLAKEHRLPYQLIEDRLKHLDDVEKQVAAL